MTAAIAIQRKPTGPSTMLHILTMAFAALTLLSALLSMILGSRLSTLQTNFLASEKETATSEAASIQVMEATLKSAMEKFETTQKRLNEEKAAAEKLRQQLAGVMKDLEKAKAGLASANQTISSLKSAAPGQSAPAFVTPKPIPTPAVIPSTETVSPQPPAVQSVPLQNKSSMALPAPVKTQADPPAMIAPEPSTSPTPAAIVIKPEIQVDTAILPATAPLPPGNTPPVTEETIADSPKAPPPTAAPAAE